MRITTLAIVLGLTQVPSVMAESEAGTPGAGGLSQAQIETLLTSHNEARQADGVNGNLRWATDLAAMAQQWAQLRSATCDLKHSRNSGLGENLYKASAVMYSDGKTAVQDISGSAVVEKWVAEKADYDYGSNACKEGKMCGHYTQVVWADTTEVGCAMQVCPSDGQVWVCNYRPAGNVLGQKPY